MPRAKVIRIFTHDWPDHYFFFSLGRGLPKKKLRRLWYTHQGQIIGYFTVDRVLMNDGTLPTLRSLENRESAWQFKPGVWVAVCRGPFVRLREKLYYSSFRGFHYFNLKEHRGNPESKVNL